MICVLSCIGEDDEGINYHDLHTSIGSKRLSTFHTTSFLLEDEP